VSKVKEWEAAFLKWVDEAHPEVGRTIAETKDLPDETVEQLKAAIVEFKQTHTF